MALRHHRNGGGATAAGAERQRSPRVRQRPLNDFYGVKKKRNENTRAFFLDAKKLFSALLKWTTIFERIRVLLREDLISVEPESRKMI
jgi:hypothetical protein